MIVLIVRARAGLALCALVLTVFAAGAALLAARGVDSECACFGTASPSRIGSGLATRNALFALAAGLAAWLASASGGQSLPAVMAVALLTVLVLLLQDLRVLERVTGGERERGAVRWILGIRS